ncbi:MAG: hypothetical protein PHU04_03985 [Candidatus Peribacteraceae bacterium]|nr:hypothetical protein [Candidatus Peribacteraceae bacterium]
MRVELTPIQYAGEEELLGVVDVEGHNVVLYTRKLIANDPETRTVKPTLEIRAVVPSITQVGHSDLRYDLVTKVDAFLSDRLKKDYIVYGSTSGLVCVPKTVEHLEQDERHVDTAGMHPAFFEHSRMCRQDMLACLDPMVAKIQAVLQETRSDLELLSSEPPPPEAAVRAARDLLHSVVWAPEPARQQAADDGRVLHIPASYEGMCYTYKSSLPAGIDWHALEHGMRTVFAGEKLDMDVVHRRVSRRGTDESCLFLIRATPESHQKLTGS